MPVDASIVIFPLMQEVFALLTMISVVHSFVLMRVCIHIINKVYPDKQEKTQ